jgi:hypothetical protein
MCAYRNLKEVHYKLITRPHKQTHIIHGVLTNRVWDLRGEATETCRCHVPCPLVPIAMVLLKKRNKIKQSADPSSKELKSSRMPI